MKGIRIVAIAAVLCVLPLSVVSARGAGGVTWGQEFFYPSLSGNSTQASFSGGYGYGVSHDGTRFGGFVLSLNSSIPDPTFMGGFVGFISGQEVHLGPVIGALNLWTGIGGMRASPIMNTPDCFALFGELDLEVGFAFSRAMELTGYVGVQGITGLVEGQPLFHNVMWAPVLGLRLAFGSF